MNTTKTNRPPLPDEAYWSALLAQEKVATPRQEEKPLLPGPELEPAEAPLPAFAANGHGLARAWHWDRAERAYALDEPLELKVIGYNKGGLLVAWGALQGFVPASQLDNMPHFHIESERIRELKRRQQQTLRLKIIEIDRHSNRLILSERAARVAAPQRRRLLQSIQPGDTLHGCVTNLTDFGAFVDLGGVEGLIHISELSWSRVRHPSDIVSANQEVTVQVQQVDIAQERVALSLKRRRPNPWETVEQRYHVGQIVEGVVANIVSFGVFLEVEEGLEGLIHVSELTDGTFLHPRNVVQRGDHLKARVLEVDGANNRLALSLLRLDAGNGHDEGKPQDAPPG